jgi:hypothetical protein
MIKKILSMGLIAALALAIVPTAFALHSPQHYELFGDASYVSPGIDSNRAVELTSEGTNLFSGIDYGVESGLTFADIEELSSDYMFETGDTCGLGSPRFQINVDQGGVEKNIFAYWGSYPAYADCATATSTGDLLEPGLYVDTSQLGGTFYHEYSDAVADFGGLTVTGIQLVVDGPNQTVVVDNTMVDTTLFTYEIPVAMTRDECRNGGWRTLADNNGNGFKNQGDCVSFVSTGGRNTATSTNPTI